MKHFWRRNIGIITVAFLILLPLIEWLRLRPLALRFQDLFSSFTSLGQIFGLAGMMMFSLNLILAGRLKLLDKFFYGLNNLYARHREIGSISFSLLLFHPLFLSAVYLDTSIIDAARFLLPFDNLYNAYGFIALWLMIILIGLTFYGSLKYHNWKLTHKLMLLSFAFALLHVYFIASDVSRDLILKTYILGFGLVGFGLAGYRSLLSRFINNDFKYKVVRIDCLGSKINELVLESLGRPMDFLPGQFVFARIFAPSLKSESHPFSISSAPDSKTVSLTIKSLGDYTGGLGKVSPGAEVSLEGPYGKFSYLESPNKNQIWIAGGVGITPFLSMARSLKSNSLRIDLYYCVKNETEAVFLNELKNLASRLSSFRLIPWYSSEHGHLSARAVDLKSGLTGKDILICGPLGLISSLKHELKGLKIPNKNILTEEFKLL